MILEELNKLKNHLDNIDQIPSKIGKVQHYLEFMKDASSLISTKIFTIIKTTEYGFDWEGWKENVK